MKLSKELNQLINEQIVNELKNANIYWQIATYCDELGLENLTNYFKKQSDDERSHAKIFMDFLNDRIDGKVKIGKVDAPNLNLRDIRDVAKLYLDAETSTTVLIEHILYTALKSMDFMTFTELQSFMTEQREEEKSASDFNNRLKLVLDSNDSLLILDHYYHD